MQPLVPRCAVCHLLAVKSSALQSPCRGPEGGEWCGEVTSEQLRWRKAAQASGLSWVVGAELWEGPQGFEPARGRGVGSRGRNLS